MTLRSPRLSLALLLLVIAALGLVRPRPAPPAERTDLLLGRWRAVTLDSLPVYPGEVVIVTFGADSQYTLLMKDEERNLFRSGPYTRDGDTIQLGTPDPDRRGGGRGQVASVSKDKLVLVSDRQVNEFVRLAD